MKYTLKIQGLHTPPGEEVFEKAPTPPRPVALFDSDLRKISVGPALEEIWGKWPGDESIEELLGALTP